MLIKFFFTQFITKPCALLQRIEFPLDALEFFPLSFSQQALEYGVVPLQFGQLFWRIHAKLPHQCPAGGAYPLHSHNKTLAPRHSSSIARLDTAIHISKTKLRQTHEQRLRPRHQQRQTAHNTRLNDQILAPWNASKTNSETLKIDPVLYGLNVDKTTFHMK